MTDRSEYLNEARSRLAKPAAGRRRPDSLAARVEALKPEIQKARIAGKTWSEIAADIADGQTLNADVVRVAFARCGPATRSKARSRSKLRPKLASARNPPTTTERGRDDEPVQQVFDPLYDVLDNQRAAREARMNADKPL
ncbi:hypothetical protein [Sphingosinicella sp. LY1275]|uniref:hypothetical protein n=1 Tax=Sphingosinicella sp. LY1275 TaxID=3095379 RepID=UPI002ADEF2B3|nr:hypothetical protein [Sphingosinicella sp. LY1275]MEA1015327.1 hypothetical protein [Sphingosinicella sp. LY1275]